MAPEFDAFGQKLPRTISSRNDMLTACLNQEGSLTNRAAAGIIRGTLGSEKYITAAHRQLLAVQVWVNIISIHEDIDGYNSTDNH